MEKHHSSRTIVLQFVERAEELFRDAEVHRNIIVNQETRLLIDACFRRIYQLVEQLDERHRNEMPREALMKFDFECAVINRLIKYADSLLPDPETKLLR